jgi:hypothetical protein
VSGGRRSPSVRWLLESACDAMARSTGVESPRPRFVSPEAYHRLFRPLLLPELSGAQRVLHETLELFFPYLAGDHVFPSAVSLDAQLIRSAWTRSVERWARETGLRFFFGDRAWVPRPG